MSASSNDNQSPYSSNPVSVDWTDVDVLDVPPTFRTAFPLPESRQSSPSSSNTLASPHNTERTSFADTWCLPLVSRILSDENDNSAIAILELYPAILKKFGGAPIEALARAITYLQAVYLETPAFHPYICPLPYFQVPTNDAMAASTSLLLERRMIRILERMLFVFGPDVNTARRYIINCRAELIPRPLFVVSTKPNSERLANGVGGFNNDAPCGETLWQSPVFESVWRRQIEQEAFSLNIRNCLAAIKRKREQQHPKLATPPPPPPPAPAPAIPYGDVTAIQPIPHAPAYQMSLPRPVTAPQFPPNPAPQITPIVPLRPNQPPQIFHAPPPINVVPAQAPVPPQPNPTTFQPQPPAILHPPVCVPLPAPMTCTSDRPMPLPSRPVTPADLAFKDDIARLEVQMSRLLQLVEANSRTEQ